MHVINLVPNPFDPRGAAWLDEYGRIGVKVKGEHSVDWYVFDKDEPLLDERTMIVYEPFNPQDLNFRI